MQKNQAKTRLARAPPPPPPPPAKNKASKGEVEQLRQEVKTLRTKVKTSPQPTPKKKAAAKAKGGGPARVRTNGQAKLHNAKPIVPLTWKFACADAPTRSTTSYTRMSLTFDSDIPQQPRLNLERFNENTIFLFMPAVSDYHLIALDGEHHKAAAANNGLRAFVRDAASSSGTKCIASFPGMVGALTGQRDGTTNFNRVAVNAGSLSICCKFPGTCGTLNIRRVTLDDINERKLNHSSNTATPAYTSILDSLREDTVMTYHLNLTGVQRINMPAGIHNADAIGHFTNIPAKKFQWYDGASGMQQTAPQHTDGSAKLNITSDDLHLEPLGGIIFSFSSVQVGNALPNPSITISTGVQYTQELTMLSANLKDDALERSIPKVKEAYSMQAKSGPFRAGHETSDRVLPTIMNGITHGSELVGHALRQGVEAIARNPAGAAELAANAMRYLPQAMRALE